MANAGDKITSWQSLYDAINRVINLPATGSASAFTATTALDNNDVASGNSIDDDDLNNLIDRYNALKTDSLYGSNSQLTSDAHTSSTVSLYSVNPTTVAAGGLLNATSDAEVNNIVNNLNQITCRNIVTCNNASTSTCNRATGYSCTQSYYSSCYRKNSYYYDCSERYYVTYSCRDTVCYKMASCKKACYAYGSGGGVYCGYSSMKSYYCNG